MRDHAASFFLTNLHHTVDLPIRQLLARSKNDASRFSHSRMWGFLKTEALERRYPSCERNYCLSSKPSFSDFLDDTKWLLKLAYLANIYQHLSTLNTCMHPQRKQSTLHRKLAALFYKQIFVTVFLGDIAPLCFIRQMFIFTFQITQLSVPVVARSKAYVCGRSPAEIVGSNPTGGMDVCQCCVLSARGLYDELITGPEEPN